jgi:23S rRNA pseudouridine1911/1915/1917 synthase
VVAIPAGLCGERVDIAIARMFGLSRSRAAELVAAGQVRLDGALPAKSERVVEGSSLEVTLPPPPAPVQVVAGSVPGLSVVHQDADLLVVDKPVGVAAHPSVGWSGPTVLGHLAAAGHQLTSSGVPERQGIVSRLDVGTSGLMVVAKSEVAYSRLKDAFRSRRVDKTYHALVQGHPDPLTGTVDAPIYRHPRHAYKYAVGEGGRHSVTHYETLEAHRFASLIEVKLETGRTHQIRVHMSALHHPCVGDLTYGADPVLAKRVGITRQWLHAIGLSFEHPTSGEWVSFASPYPGDLQHALEIVRVAD